MSEAYTNPQITRVRKMLASTVQFSTYDQTPVTRPHQTQPSPRGPRRYEMQTGPDTRATSPPGSPDGSAPSGPNSVPTNQTNHHHPVPHPTASRRTRAGRTRSSTSCRPNWSAFHPRAPPHTPRRPPGTGRPITVWARLWTTRRRLAASAP